MSDLWNYSQKSSIFSRVSLIVGVADHSLSETNTRQFLKRQSLKQFGLTYIYEISEKSYCLSFSFIQDMIASQLISFVTIVKIAEPFQINVPKISRNGILVDMFLLSVST